MITRYYVFSCVGKNRDDVRTAAASALKEVHSTITSDEDPLPFRKALLAVLVHHLEDDFVRSLFLRRDEFSFERAELVGLRERNLGFLEGINTFCPLANDNVAYRQCRCGTGAVVKNLIF